MTGSDIGQPFWILIWIHYYLSNGIGLDWHLNNSFWVQNIPNVATNNINIWFFTVEYLGCQLDSKWNSEALASNVLRKINAKLKFVYQKSIHLIPAFRRLLCNVLIQPHLCMFFMASPFGEKFKDQTSKNSKQIYLFLPKFTSEISYRYIAY